MNMAPTGEFAFEVGNELDNDGLFLWNGSSVEVVARTGERSEYVDKARLVRSLKAAEMVAAIEDRSNWTWTEDHTRFVVNVAGDLFAAGLDGVHDLLLAGAVIGESEDLRKQASGFGHVSAVRMEIIVSP